MSISPLEIMLSAHKLANIKTLHERDFFYLYFTFKEILGSCFPSFKNLYFFSGPENVASYVRCSLTRKSIEDYFKNTQTQNYYKCIGQNIILSFVTDDCRMIAVIEEVDAYFSKHVSIDWLEKSAANCYQEFIKAKQLGTDLETGLLNARQFYSDLEKHYGNSTASLLLIEAYPKARNALEGQRHKNKVVRSLLNCSGNIAPYYYLGHYVFALLIYSDVPEKISRLGARVISWLRKDGLRRIHVGMRTGSGEDGSLKEKNCSLQIVNQAWCALQAARKKGPFGICDFEQLMHPENSPLRRPKRSLLAKFQRKWSECNTFSIIQLEPEKNEAKEVLLSLFDKESLICDGSDIYLFKEGLQPQDALAWITVKLSKIEKNNILVGIAYYPHLNFSKSATILQCRKALLHAAFYGKNGKAIFDSVSLNVSGDIYYTEGDLASAIKEYREGLQCDPDNINLLNSLGVSYADIDRFSEAQRCFEKALSIDSNDFMALYNLGLGAEKRGCFTDAIAYYERANNVKSEFPEVADELKYHLGRLYSIVGRYQEAVEMLQSWYGAETESKNNGRALAYLGKAFYGLKDYDQAMKWLQRALRFDEFDGESMGLLGLVYLIKQEGNDIALSLCERGADLVPDNLSLKLYLARSLISNRRFADARAVLRACRRRHDVKFEAQLLTSLAYKGEGKVARAKYWLDKCLQNSTTDADLASLVKNIQEKLYGV